MMRKAKTYARLKRDLDATFSQWTRQSQNIPHCVSCGVVKDWKELQAGHFVTRVRLATRWNPENVHPQCSVCNVLRRGNYAGYARWMVNEYGPDIFAELEAKSREPTKYSRSDLAALIEDYRAKLNDLEAG